MGFRFGNWFSLRPGRRGNRRKNQKSANAGPADVQGSDGKREPSAHTAVPGSGLKSPTNLNRVKPWVVLVPCAAFAAGFAIAGYAISHHLSNGNGLLLLPFLIGGAALGICLWLSRGKPPRTSAAEPVQPAPREDLKPAPPQQAAPPQPGKPVAPKHKPNTVYLKPMPTLEARRMPRLAPNPQFRSKEPPAPPNPAPPPTPPEKP